jgi:hypothetical protein
MLDGMATVAGHQLVRVAVHPLRYDAATGSMRLVERARLRLQWQSAEQTSLQRAPVGDEVKRVAADLLRGREVPRPLPRGAPQDDYGWYDPTRPYCKLLLVEQGLYVVYGRDLQRLGIPAGGVAASTLRLYHRGEEIALHVADGGDGLFDADDWLLFPAERRCGDTSYFAAQSDTNVYWLSWGGSIGRRLAAAVAAPAGQDFLYWFTDTLHLEQDRHYYQGDSDAEVHNTFATPGEGWVWHFFNPGDSLSVQVPLPDLAFEGDALRLMVRLRGTTLDQANPDHHARLWFNGRLAADVWFDNRQLILLEATVPTAGARTLNDLAIASVGNTGAVIDQFYLDWIELVYPRRPQALAGRFAGYLPGSGAPRNIAIQGFSSDSILIVDVGKGRVLTDVRRSTSWWARFVVLSAGYHDGNRAEFWQDDQPLWSGGRGHNLLVLDGQSGQVLDKKNFDTYASQANADSMATYVERLPSGTVVLVAIRDEGSVAMTPRAHTALESLGSALTRQVGARDSWALIGRKGAAPGSVPEALAPARTGPVRLAEVVSFPSGGRGVTAVFRDSSGAALHLVAADLNALRRPARIVLDQPSHLRSPQNAADYLLITHPRFAAAAEELAAFRRAHNGFAVATVFIEDVYDEFTYGLAEPAAIRLLIEHATAHWQRPPRFLLLLGDACWDPKGLLAQTVKKDYVPTFGNPVSDAWFACTDGPEDFMPDLFVGRIPAESAEQAERIVRKIIAYEADSTPAAWKKHVLLINGGFDTWEQQQFAQQSRLLVDSIIAKPPASCRPVVISKTSQGYFQGEHRDDILAALNSGVLWANFVGHAGTGTWDLVFSSTDLQELHNQGRYPFVTSLTCHTARFANPYTNCFGEEFLALPQSGAVAFWGTTGWSYLFHDQVLVTNLFRAALVDTVHLLGAATTLAKLRLWESLGNSQFTRNVILQYSLLGDPATDLALPSLPDLVVEPADFSLTPATPTEEDSLVQVAVSVHNFGLATPGPVQVGLWARSPGTGAFPVDTPKLLPALGWQDCALFAWRLGGRGGSFDLEAVVDPDDSIREALETNNRATIRVPVRAVEVVLLKPFPHALLGAPPTLEVLTPLSASGAPHYVQFELDTTAEFSSGALQPSPDIPPGPLSTRWTPAPLAAGRRYCWRARAVYASGPGPWRATSFTLADGGREMRWQQYFPVQVDAGAFQGAEQTATGVRLAQGKVVLRVESAGYNDGQYARLLVGGSPALAQGRGHNVAVVHPGNGQVIQAMAFDTYESPAEAQRLAGFVAQIPEGMLVLAAIADEGSRSMNEAAYQALESIGSALCRQVGARDSWAIIGTKGAAPGSVPEKLVKRGQGVAVLQDSLFFHIAQGTLQSPLIGPATRWQKVQWQAEEPAPCTAVAVAVEAYDRTSGTWLTVQEGSGAQGTLDLSQLDAQRFRLLRVRAELSTSDGRWSPTLQWWATSFTPAAELAALPLRVAPSGSVVAGDPVQLELELHNLGYAPAEKVVVWWSQVSQAKEELFGADTLRRPLAPDSAAVVRRVWPTARLAGSYELRAKVDPADQIGEPVEFNNNQSCLVEVLRDSLAPAIELLADGRAIAAGEFVSARPQILVRLYDNTGGALTDTSGLHLLLDGNRLSFAGVEPRLQLLPPDPAGDQRLKGSVVCQPTLNTGRHEIEVLFTDPNGNTSHLRVDFQVAERLELREVVNFPNPFRAGTDFCYVLTAPADEVNIRVYTLAGRLIKTLRDAPGAAGFNRVHWDGRDEDGDELANGVYLYKVTATQEGKQVAVIGKAVVAR